MDLPLTASPEEMFPTLPSFVAPPTLIGVHPLLFAFEKKLAEVTRDCFGGSSESGPDLSRFRIGFGQAKGLLPQVQISDSHPSPGGSLGRPPLQEACTDALSGSNHILARKLGVRCSLRVSDCAFIPRNPLMP